MVRRRTGKATTQTRHVHRSPADPSVPDLAVLRVRNFGWLDLGLTLRDVVRTATVDLGGILVPTSAVARMRIAARGMIVVLVETVVPREILDRTVGGGRTAIVDLGGILVPPSVAARMRIAARGMIVVLVETVVPREILDRTVGGVRTAIVDLGGILVPTSVVARIRIVARGMIAVPVGIVVPREIPDQTVGVAQTATVGPGGILVPTSAMARMPVGDRMPVLFRTRFPGEVPQAVEVGSPTGRTAGTAPNGQMGNGDPKDRVPRIVRREVNLPPRSGSNATNCSRKMSPPKPVSKVAIPPKRIDQSLPTCRADRLAASLVGDKFVNRPLEYQNRQSFGWQRQLTLARPSLVGRWPWNPSAIQAGG